MPTISFTTDVLVRLGMNRIAGRADDVGCLCLPVNVEVYESLARATQCWSCPRHGT